MRQRTNLNPWIESQVDANKWQKMIPYLRNMELRTLDIQLSFFHLHSLTIDASTTLDPKLINDWNCPLLEHLKIVRTLTSNSAIRILSVKFPKLKSLSIWLKCIRDMTISGFLNLETLRIASQSKNHLQICISNLPSLIDFKIDDGFIDILNVHNVGNINSISYTTSHYSIGLFNRLIFHTPIPFLESLSVNETPYVGDGFLEIDPYEKVNWENVKVLRFVYTNTCAKVCSRLNKIKYLEINEINEGDVAFINWGHLTHLTHLVWNWPSFDFLSSLIKNNLQSFSIRWSKNFTMDFAMLLHFPNLSNVRITTISGKYLHFESLLLLPQLKTLTCNMANLKNSDTNWRIANLI